MALEIRRRWVQATFKRQKCSDYLDMGDKNGISMKGDSLSSFLVSELMVAL